MSEIRVIWRGKRLNRRTVAMLLEAERICPGSFTFRIVQGSYNAGGVSASAGTHDGGGAVDVGLTEWGTTVRKNIELALRKVGFAAWIRSPAQGPWSWHCHGIAIGDDDLSSGAAFQVAEYKRGRNGLANRGADTGPGGYRLMTWERYKATHAVPAPVPMTGGIPVALADDILAEVRGLRSEEKGRYAFYTGKLNAILAAIADTKELVAFTKQDLANHRSEEKGRYGDVVRRLGLLEDQLTALTAKIDAL